MKTHLISYLLVILIFSGLQGMAQITAKGSRQSTKKTVMPSGQLPSQTIFSTTRNDDLKSFDKYNKMLQNALLSGSPDEAGILRNRLSLIALREISRSQANLKELEAGKTKALEEWYAENAPDKKLYPNIEKQNLQSRINYEKEIYKQIMAIDLKEISGDKQKNSITGYLNGFEDAMNKNMKFGDAMPKNSPPPPPPPPDGHGTAVGSGSVTKKGNGEKMPSGDARIQRWNDSKAAYQADFLKKQDEFQKALDKDNFNMSKSLYRALTTIMMNEINSNNWMLNQVRNGNISGEGTDITALEKEVRQQQKLLDEARGIKVSTADAMKANASKATGILQKFAGTLH